MYVAVYARFSGKNLVTSSNSWVSYGRILSRIRVGACVHSAFPSVDRLTYLGSWETSVCLRRRIFFLGVRGASQSVGVTHNIDAGAPVSNNILLSSSAFNNTYFGHVVS